MNRKQPFHNFTVDHMTLLFDQKLYPIIYATFRIIFGTTPDDLLYEKRRVQKDTGKEMSMTFATRVGEWEANQNKQLHTVFAIVQPSEGPSESSHVREMLEGHDQGAHLQHVALRTTDLIAFHKYAQDRGVQFITPILKDEEDNLIQVFSGEWFFPGTKQTGLFFEFLQRNPSNSELADLQKANGETWFRDKTFLGLYGEKEAEYQSGKVTSFLPPELFMEISNYIGPKQVWQITEDDLDNIEKLMLKYGPKK
ncbi:hypothetical protein D3C87_1406630 [compost metagenome]